MKLKPLFERLLDYYNLTEEEFNSISFDVTESNFAQGKSFDNINEIADYMHSMVKANKKILVYGDYDTDGMMATSIIVKMFSYLDYAVDYYIPNRYKDGYGLNLERSQDIVEAKYDLVITVDNGITAFEAIEYLRKNNIDVVVLDHHEARETLPNCNYYLHPILSHFSNVTSSGGFVCFMFSMAFLGRYDKYLATLASISIISDLMPLSSYNRNFLRLVFKNYKDREFFNIDLFKAGLDFNEIAIRSTISPKINAVGRIAQDDSISKLVEYFISEDKAKIYEIFEWISSFDSLKKSLLADAKNKTLEYHKEDTSIVFITDAVEGVIGLIAMRLLNTYNVPVIVLTKDSKGIHYKGSCRVPKGYNAMKAFESVKDLVPNYGGHPGAGGFSVEIEKFNDFEKRIKEYFANNIVEVKKKEPITLLMTELTFDNYNLVRQFAPFGIENEDPVFVLPKMLVDKFSFSKDYKHINTPIDDFKRIKLVGFNFSKDSMKGLRTVDLKGSLEISMYTGNKTLQFKISEII